MKVLYNSTKAEEFRSLIANSNVKSTPTAPIYGNFPIWSSVTSTLNGVLYGQDISEYAGIVPLSGSRWIHKHNGTVPGEEYYWLSGPLANDEIYGTQAKAETAAAAILRDDRLDVKNYIKSINDTASFRNGLVDPLISKINNAFRDINAAVLDFDNKTCTIKDILESFYEEGKKPDYLDFTDINEIGSDETSTVLRVLWVDADGNDHWLTMAGAVNTFYTYFGVTASTVVYTAAEMGLFDKSEVDNQATDATDKSGVPLPVTNGTPNNGTSSNSNNSSPSAEQVEAGMQQAVEQGARQTAALAGSGLTSVAGGAAIAATYEAMTGETYDAAKIHQEVESFNRNVASAMGYDYDDIANRLSNETNAMVSSGFTMTAAPSMVLGLPRIGMEDDDGSGYIYGNSSSGGYEVRNTLFYDALDSMYTEDTYRRAVLATESYYTEMGAYNAYGSALTTSTALSHTGADYAMSDYHGEMYANDYSYQSGLFESTPTSTGHSGLLGGGSSTQVISTTTGGNISSITDIVTNKVPESFKPGSGTSSGGTSTDTDASLTFFGNNQQVLAKRAEANSVVDNAFNGKGTEEFKELLSSGGYDDMTIDYIMNHKEVAVTAYIVANESKNLTDLANTIAAQNNIPNFDTRYDNGLTQASLTDGSARAKLLAEVNERVTQAREELSAARSSYNSAVQQANDSIDEANDAKDKLDKVKAKIVKKSGEDAEKWSEEDVDEYNAAIEKYNEANRKANADHDAALSEKAALEEAEKHLVDVQSKVEEEYKADQTSLSDTDYSGGVSTLENNVTRPQEPKLQINPGNVNPENIGGEVKAVTANEPAMNVDQNAPAIHGMGGMGYSSMGTTGMPALSTESQSASLGALLDEESRNIQAASSSSSSSTSDSSGSRNDEKNDEERHSDSQPVFVEPEKLSQRADNSSVEVKNGIQVSSDKKSLESVNIEG